VGCAAAPVRDKIAATITGAEVRMARKTDANHDRDRDPDPTNVEEALLDHHIEEMLAAFAVGARMDEGPESCEPPLD
jgi:hypothetical protein